MVAREYPNPFAQIAAYGLAAGVSIARVAGGGATLPADMSETLRYLRTEFANELSAIEGKPLESIELSEVYTRLTGIAGQPINDNNLGRTIVNNDGRPRHVRKALTTTPDSRRTRKMAALRFNVNGEYQYAPSAPAYPLQTRLVLASVNNEPVQAGHCIPHRQSIQAARHLRRE